MSGLSDLRTTEPGLRRWLHGILALPPARRARTGVFGTTRQAIGYVARIAYRMARRLVEWSWDNASTYVLDTLDGLRARPEPILRQEPGESPALESRSVALFVQFSPDGTLTDMVKRQLEIYRDLGFATVLVSNSPAFPEESWQEARRRAALVVHRRNSGLDFGAWKDLLPVALARWPQADEVLIVNDSVLGPIRPLGPVLAAMRAAGPGFFGLLESIQGGPHLQSWFTLARGRKAVDDLAAFMAGLRLSRSKWKIIQRGELRMARSMRRAGNRVAAVHGYEALVDLGLTDPQQRAYLERALPLWFAGADEAAVRARLFTRPVNPSHHFWRILAGPAGCPFIKTELVRRNPGRLPEVETWPDLVPADAPCPVEMLKAHLAVLGP